MQENIDFEEAVNILDNAPLSIHFVDINGKILWANKEELKLLGYTKEEYVGRFIANFQAEYTEKELDSDMRNKHLNNESINDCEAKLICKDGRIIDVQINSNMYFKDGKHIYTRCFIQDITYLKKIQQDAEEKRRMAEEDKYKQAKTCIEEAETYRKKLERFIDTVCHEIRNPLNVIMGNADLLKIYVDELTTILKSVPGVKEAQRLTDLFSAMNESIKSVHTCAYHQRVITSDVLELSKLEANAIQLNNIPFHPKEVILSIMSTFDTEFHKKKIGKILHLPDEDFVVIGDPTRLSQILINLLSNALKFTHTGSIEVKVCYQVMQTSTEIEVAITDTGIGMTDEEQAQLFNRFAQANLKTFSEYGGSGLGLYISKNLANLMQGDIRVKSKKWHGTTFTLNVKCNNFDLITHSSLSNQSPIVNKPEVRSLEFDPSKINILVAEDNTLNQALLKNILKKLGYHYHIVENGKKAVEIYKKEKFHLILMDMEMPVMNGTDAAKNIREFEETSGKTRTPILCISGYARGTHAEEAKTAGMDDFICKPFSIENIAEKMLEQLTAVKTAQHSGDAIFDTETQNRMSHKRSASGTFKIFSPIPR